MGVKEIFFLLLFQWIEALYLYEKYTLRNRFKEIFTETDITVEISTLLNYKIVLGHFLVVKRHDNQVILRSGAFPQYHLANANGHIVATVSGKLSSSLCCKSFNTCCVKTSIWLQQKFLRIYRCCLPIFYILHSVWICIFIFDARANSHIVFTLVDFFLLPFNMLDANENFLKDFSWK